ncbi:MAG TPA: PHP domain-containing protein [Chthonomonadales bacterium]|nr:PHP domain-containing protein [Chthonomonadales bacterium]
MDGARCAGLRGIDLHVHTTASDGSLTPAEVVALAARTGLRAIAITDHDTVAGLDEALAAGPEHGVKVVPGVELTPAYPHGKLHLLGYGIDHRHPALTEGLRRVGEARIERNERMAARLVEIGLPITLGDIAAEAAGEQIGRPHMALALVRKGVVATVQEAFDRFLDRDGPAHVSRRRLPLADSVAMIRDSGGVPVVAHPHTLQPPGGDWEAELRRLRSMGIDGLECYYSRYTPDDAQRYLALARAVALLVTGGSDFHGTPKPGVRLGGVDAGLPAPDALLHALMAHHRMVRHAEPAAHAPEERPQDAGGERVPL